MTADQISAMEAGPEMDWSVAAIYEVWGSAIPDNPLEPCFIVLHDLERREFSPSTDWNDAMFAAEQFGLLTIHSACIGTWGFDYFGAQRGDYRVFQPGDFGINISTAQTGPLAICRAILTLAAERA